MLYEVITGYIGEIIVMPNGTPDIDPSPARAAAARKKFKLPDEPILLYCGQMNWKKNISRILESCACYKQSGGKFRITSYNVCYTKLLRALADLIDI